jgi:hypothetical protein
VRIRRGFVVLALAWLTLPSPPAHAGEGDSTSVVVPAAAPVRLPNGLEAMVPDVAAHPYHMEPGPRPYRNRFAFSPGFGALGSEKLFTFRAAYNPNSWLGYEAALDHNPGQSVHAVLHSLSALVRYPLPGRFQPYACAGYGMVMVFPGRAIQADPVTKNALTVGGGLELYIRGDLAIRAEVRRATVIGRQRGREGVVAYDYLEQTVGLSFYRSIQP